MNDYISGIHHHGAHQGEYVTHHDHPITIDAVHGARILDSRGYPTVRVSSSWKTAAPSRGTPPRAHPPAPTKPSSSVTAVPRLAAVTSLRRFT